MQSWYLLGTSSPDCGGGLLLPSRKPASLLGPSRCPNGRTRRPGDRAGPVAASSGWEQDHYAVLGLPRSASTADVKRAYRILARKYHPDVSKELRAGELFKSIHLAYEVLNDEVTRAKYDMRLKFPTTIDEPWRGRWAQDEEPDERRRMRKWAEKLRQRMQYEAAARETSWYNQRDAFHQNSGYERGSFSQVVQFAFFSLLFMRLVGYRITLTFCGLAACFDKQLDVGYKMAYIIAWLLGGQGGILLSLCIYFTSWLCGKNSSSLVAVVVVAMWVAANLARFVPLPQGAVLTLLYMSIRLQVDLK